MYVEYKGRLQYLQGDIADTAVCFRFWSGLVFLSQQKGKIEQRYFAEK